MQNRKRTPIEQTHRFQEEVKSLALVSKDFYHCMRADERNIVCRARALKRDVRAFKEAFAVSTARNAPSQEWSAKEVRRFLLID
jgi:hypothetical protein